MVKMVNRWFHTTILEVSVTDTEVIIGTDFGWIGYKRPEYIPHAGEKISYLMHVCEDTTFPLGYETLRIVIGEREIAHW